MFTGVLITGRSSEIPWELFTLRTSTNFAWHKREILRFSCKGFTSKRTQSSIPLVNILILLAWMEDVLAPESTLALMAGMPSSSNLHHSSPPNTSKVSNIMLFLIDYSHDEKVQYFHQYQQNDDPFQPTALPLVHDVLEKPQVLLDDLPLLLDGPIAVLEIEELFQIPVQTVELLIFPYLLRGIKN